MPPNLLILGGTAEATRLAEAVAARGIPAVVSLAGRVDRPKPTPVPRRVGGFGGVPGLVAYLQAEAITHVIDATHPFAAQMSRNAAAACAETGVPLVALTRPPWAPKPGDQWTRVPDMAGAVAALEGPSRRVLLSIGRMHLAEFFGLPQHHYLLRLVDPPSVPLAFPDHEVILDRGPFSYAADRALLEDRRIDLVVSKNAGGRAAVAKIDAARDLGLPVIMIDRPALPPRVEVHDVEACLAWVRHAGTDLGV